MITNEAVQAAYNLRSANILNTYFYIETYLNKLSMDLERHTQRRNELSAYMTALRGECEKYTPSSNAISEIESRLMEFFNICKVISPVTEIKSCDEGEVIQYENLVSIIKCCHKINLRNSRIVFRLLEMILSMHLVDPNEARHIRPQTYHDGFLQYVMFHIENDGHDINILLSHYSNTVWDFFNQFSTLNAVAEGETDKLLFLLNSGVQIFPEHELIKSGHCFPGISQTLRRNQMMILEIMKKMHKKFLMEEALSLKVSQEQRNCFEIMWQKVPDAHVSEEHFSAALREEYDHLLHHGVDEEKCEIRLRKMKRLVNVYLKHFSDIPKIPRNIFKHIMCMQYGITAKSNAVFRI